MDFITHKILTAVFVLLGTTVVVDAQTSAELRVRYGEPLFAEIKDNRVAVERFLVRPNIIMTIKYTYRGEPCEALLEPVPNSTPKTGRSEHAPESDYMSTVEVIELLNELLPIETRGKKISEFLVDGGDREMKLHHVGCTGYLVATFENVSVRAFSWCWGGTFFATLHWGKTNCPGQMKFKDK